MFCWFFACEDTMEEALDYVNKKDMTDYVVLIENDIDKTLIFYEAPHKLKNTLTAISEVLGNRKITLARELTKLHEDFTYGFVNDILTDVKEPKGEYVIIVEGNQNNEDDIVIKLNEASLEEHFGFYKNLGYSKKDIIKMIAKDRNVPKNDIYQYFLNDTNS